jgi:hypothetical protein
MKSSLGEGSVDATHSLDDLRFDSELYTDEAGHFGQVGLRRMALAIVNQLIVRSRC